MLKAGELLGGAGASEAIYRLRAGWACQFHDLANGRRVILDIYLPGDVIGLYVGVNARPLEEVLTLTAATIETIPGEDALGRAHIRSVYRALYCVSVGPASATFGSPSRWDLKP